MKQRGEIYGSRSPHKTELQTFHARPNTVLPLLPADPLVQLSWSLVGVKFETHKAYYA